MPARSHKHGSFPFTLDISGQQHYESQVQRDSQSARAARNIKILEISMLSKAKEISWSGGVVDSPSAVWVRENCDNASLRPARRNPGPRPQRRGVAKSPSDACRIYTLDQRLPVRGVEGSVFVKCPLKNNVLFS